MINPHAVTLTKALNEFIQDAKQNISLEGQTLVLIADNIDKNVGFRTSTQPTLLSK